MATAYGVEKGRSRPATPSRGSPARVSPDPLRSSLAALIEGEIIPRLIASHRPVEIVRPSSSRAVSPVEAAEFARLPLTLEADELVDRVDALLSRGVEPGSVLVDLLAPSARELGRMWEEDECSFVDVTMGLWRLQQVMRELAWRAPPATGASNDGPSALFSTLPGEQHSFGTLMIGEVFTRGGWRSEVLIEPTRHDLLAAVGSQPFDLVGLTVSRDCPSGELRKLVSAIRGVSHNGQVKIMIGGRLVNLDPSLADECGADGTAPDAYSALAFADRLVDAGRRLTLNPH
ncbi:cobalamin-dependent protein [Sphingomonas sp. ASV193]|uniref:cobalamin B12-binding domain-containing protein n=1 Tax=Sphingomonas sp. ASV193 TaxID=3144405 RepID=UPI0032E8E0FE